MYAQNTLPKYQIRWETSLSPYQQLLLIYTYTDYPQIYLYVSGITCHVHCTLYVFCKIVCLNNCLHKFYIIPMYTYEMCVAHKSQWNLKVAISLYIHAILRAATYSHCINIRGTFLSNFPHPMFVLDRWILLKWVQNVHMYFVLICKWIKLHDDADEARQYKV